MCGALKRKLKQEAQLFPRLRCRVLLRQIHVVNEDDEWSVIPLKSRRPAGKLSHERAVLVEKKNDDLLRAHSPL